MARQVSHPVRRMTPLEELRRARALTREELAALSGVCSRTITRLERERTRPHKLTARAIAEVLECNPDWIRAPDDVAPMLE